jgi:hypothetical protein
MKQEAGGKKKYFYQMLQASSVKLHASSLKPTSDK